LKSEDILENMAYIGAENEEEAPIKSLNGYRFRIEKSNSLRANLAETIR
jgi:hypothetical protein